MPTQSVEEKLATLPTKPGCYLHKGADQQVKHHFNIIIVGGGWHPACLTGKPTRLNFFVRAVDSLGSNKR